jgi:ribulose-5-phosphate 4-epimerase/fuculose-1-phosphate aldolase
MADLKAFVEEIVTANRILAHEGVVDTFGHITVRHPEQPNRFLMSRARAPQLVEASDIMEFTLDGKVVGAEAGKPYSERFIHGAIYEARQDVSAVVHNHSRNVVPFTVTKRRMRPMMHMCGPMGNEIPNWDIREKFGDTNLLVTSMAMARDFASALGGNTVGLMRGHGCTIVGGSIREVVFLSIYTELNAEMLIKALTIGNGEVAYLSDGEIATIRKGRAGFSLERGWENWCSRVGRPYIAHEWTAGEGYSQSESL